MKFRDKLILKNTLVMSSLISLLLWALSLSNNHHHSIISILGMIDIDADVENSFDISDEAVESVFTVDYGDRSVYPPIEEYGSAPYPQYTPLLSVLQSWNPDDPDIPSTFTETLQHFNYSDSSERAMAEKYRNAELPFKIYGIPDIEHVRKKWSKPYLERSLRYEFPKIEKSSSNHFMYFKQKRDMPKNYIPPQETVYRMPFSQWVQLAEEADRIKLSNNSVHYYYTLGSTSYMFNSFIVRDLPMFSTKTENFFITRVSDNKGIQCRLGMRGVIAESHYDSGRNMVAMIRGMKRYILTPPHTCQHLGIISDTSHPSYRHSVIDWSDMSEARANHFDKVDSVDTIVRAGEILYIPSFWFHYIVSLKYSIQCNSRSGHPARMNGYDHIRRCHSMNLGNKNNKLSVSS